MNIKDLRTVITAAKGGKVFDRAFRVGTHVEIWAPGEARLLVWAADGPQDLAPLEDPDAVNLSLKAFADVVAAADDLLYFDAALSLATTDANRPYGEPGKALPRGLYGAGSCHEAIEIIRALKETAFAMSVEEARYYLKGVFMHAVKGSRSLTFVATDGHRLGVSRIGNNRSGSVAETLTVLRGLGDQKGIIIPQSVVAFIKRLSKGLGKDLFFSALDGGRHFVFSGTYRSIRWSLTFCPIAACYPDYHRVIPHEVKHLTFQGPTKALATLAEVAKKTSRLRGIGWKNHHELALQDGQWRVGDYPITESAAGIKTAWQKGAVGFNPTYLLDFAKAFPDGHIQFWGDDAGSPFLVRVGGETVGVIMPVRVNDFAKDA